MQTQRTFLEEIKHQYKTGGVITQLIAINLVVFLLASIAMVFWRLSLGEDVLIVQGYLGQVLALQTDFGQFIRHPWGLFTNMFSHFSFLHILFNMIFLYMAGRIFLQFFSQKRLLYTYIVGGLFGGLFELFSKLIPTLDPNPVLGASGSVMAIIVAVAFHKPGYKINLFGTIPVPMFLIAGLYFLSDFVKIGQDDGVAHFAHLGGAVLGMISVLQLSSSSNIITRSIQVGESFLALFKSKRKPIMKKASGNARMKTDEQYNEESIDRQERVDRILDKISKSGYESLTRKEKDFLFKQSGK
ncbi:MAG: membrane associated rhomboid family serine protease [Flavobacteriaceae bacterium]|jgi:membrane associated rhomboid family serine protease